MKRLPPDAARASRGIFFFSGHGFAMFRDNQLLLPADYLSPPVANWNDAISTSNLENGLAVLHVPLQMFFIDACRNAPTALRKKRIRGTDILPEDNNETSNSAYISPILYATNNGQQAFQHPDPSKGLSLFGRALLDGLAGKPDLRLAATASSLLVNLFPLQEFTEAKVLEQLAAAHEIQPQPVVLGGNSRNAMVTQLPPHVRPGAEKALQIRSGAEAPVPLGAADQLEAIAAKAATGEAQATAGFGASAQFGVPRSVWQRDFAIAHPVFGSEKATNIWSHRAQLFSMLDGVALDDPDALNVGRVWYDRPTLHWKVELSVDHFDPIGHVLQLTDGNGNPWTTVIPTVDAASDTRYEVEFEFGEHLAAQPERPLTRVDASVATSSTGSASVVAQLWRAYRFAGPSQALAAIAAFVQESDAAFTGSPFVAILAGLLALRLGDDGLTDRLIKLVDRNVATGSWRLDDERARGVEADLAALIMGYSVGRGSLSWEFAGLNTAAFVAVGSVPRTTEGILVARMAARRLLRNPELSSDDRLVLQPARDRLDAAAESIGGDGLFTTYAQLTAPEVLRLIAPRRAVEAWRSSSMDMLAEATQESVHEA
jgi:Caspase domain